MRTAKRAFDPRQVMHRPDFEVFHYHDPKMQEVPLHHHDFYEVYCFLGGKVEYQVEGRTYRLEPEDILLISPRELHRPNVAPEAAYERIVLWIDAAFLEGLSAEGLRPADCFETDRNLIPGAHTQAAALIRQLAAEAASDRVGHELCARGLCLQFLAELLRLSEDRAQPEREREEPPLVAEVLGYLGEHYREELTLDAVAKRFFVSKYYLSHLFSRSVGTSMYRYILLKRLQRAKQLLSEGVQAGDACRDCGFQDYANFYRSFASVYGQTPQEAARRSLDRPEIGPRP